MDSRNKIFTGAACLGVAGILLYQFLSAHQQVYWLSVLFLGLLMFVCESLGENLRTRGTSTYGITVLTAALLALNTPSAMLVALCGAFSLQDLKTKKNPWVMVFNGLQYAIGLAAAAFVYHALGGSSRAFELGETLKSIPILLLAMLVFWVINSAMTSLASYWEYGLEPREFYKKDAIKLLPNYIFYTLLGMALGDHLRPERLPHHIPEPRDGCRGGGERRGRNPGGLYRSHYRRDGGSGFPGLRGVTFLPHGPGRSLVLQRP